MKIFIFLRKNDLKWREATMIPGPGSYEPMLKNKKTFGNIKIGTQSRETLNKEAVNIPGPGSYDANYKGVKEKEPTIRS
jgi:hypothetical protein